MHLFSKYRLQAQILKLPHELGLWLTTRTRAVEPESKFQAPASAPTYKNFWLRLQPMEIILTPDPDPQPWWNLLSNTCTISYMFICSQRHRCSSSIPCCKYRTLITPALPRSSPNSILLFCCTLSSYTTLV